MKILGEKFEYLSALEKARFPNEWEESGKKAYLEADKLGLGEATKLVEAIKEKNKL